MEFNTSFISDLRLAIVVLMFCGLPVGMILGLIWLLWSA